MTRSGFIRHDTLDNVLEENDRKIRVCFVSPKAYPIFNSEVESVFGGAEVDLYMIATELAKDASFEVSFIVADYGQADEEVRENVRVLKSINFQHNLLGGLCKIWTALKKADADIYMIKTASPGVPLVQSFCRRGNRKFIYKTANQGECDGTYQKTHPILGRLFINSLRKAWWVIVQNKQDQDNLCHCFDLDSAIVPNGHRIPDIVNSHKETVLWVGRSAAIKGPRRFLELAKAFPDERFVMICQKATGDENYQSLCDEAGKIENLTFLKRVPFREIETFFEQAKVFVNTSDSEGFPNTFIQACKASAAILSYQVNPDEFLTKERCGLCAQGHTDNFITGLRSLLENKHYVELGSNGKQYCMSRFDISKTIEVYKQQFNTIARH